MDSRKSALVNLVQLKGDLSTLERTLNEFPWDSQETLYVLQKEDLLNIFARYLSSEIDAETVGNWATAIECREDLDYANDSIEAVINELANPALFDELSRELVEGFKAGLE